MLASVGGGVGGFFRGMEGAVGGAEGYGELGGGSVLGYAVIHNGIRPVAYRDAVGRGITEGIVSAPTVPIQALADSGW